MSFQKSQRLQNLPPYLFSEIDRQKKLALAAGRDVINLGVGDPDRPTPKPIIDSLRKNAEIPAYHQYALDQGAPELRHSIARFINRRYGVELDPATEILPTIGSKEAIAHLPLAVINPGDLALIPDPRYPVYWSSTTFADGTPVVMPLRAENGFLPNLDQIPADTWKRTRLMFVNYPNNPTGAVAPRSFYERIVSLAHEFDFVLAVDAAYNEMYYEQPPISILEIPGAREVAIELHSLSKTFNMTGWRVGFAIGNPSIIAALAQVKSNADSGIFTAIQMASVTALDQYESLVPPIRELYRARRDAFIAALQKIGWNVTPPPATFYIWIPCPNGSKSMDLASRLLNEASVVVTPGVGFGAASEGYIRATLTVETPRLLEAAERIGKLSL